MNRSACALFGRACPSAPVRRHARVMRSGRALARLHRRIRRCASGQASVELVAFLPLLLVVALAVFSIIAAHTADELAGEAAEAGALALLQGGDADTAARAALPKPAVRRAAIAIHGRRVQVHVRPRLPLPIPGLPELLAADARADAGPAARP